MARHISEQYELELSQIKELLMEMGGLVEQQVNNACTALATHDTDLAEEVRDVEARLNQFEVDLDDHCVAIIARRQPAAVDLRVVVSVMKVITDLERIGDEADRIAKMAVTIGKSEIPDNQHGDFREMHAMAARMLRDALDAFARQDIENAIRVLQADEEIDRGYNDIVRRHMALMRETPDEIEQYISVIWAARAIERIGDHAKNIAEYVIYQVKGLDVRHGSSDIEED